MSGKAGLLRPVESPARQQTHQWAFNDIDDRRRIAARQVLWQSDRGTSRFNGLEHDTRSEQAMSTVFSGWAASHMIVPGSCQLRVSRVLPLGAAIGTKD